MGEWNKHYDLTKYDMFVLDGTQWDIPVTFDGVHFTAEGHAAFAEALGKFFTNADFNCII